MKAVSILIGLFAAGVLGVPISSRDASVFDPDSDAFNYHNNINNAVTAEEVDPNSDSFNYHNNINNAVTAEDDGVKVVLSSPYTDDVEKADPAKILGEK